MASEITSESGDGPLCTVCLQTPDVLKVVTTCKHLCCVECLSKHLKSLSSTRESFPCPICQVECPLSENGVDGLEDHSRADGCDEEQMTKTESVACLICRAKGTSVEAESLCQECESMYLCRGCTHVHGTSKATASHVVISLASAKRKTGGSCRIHKELIGRYCCTCQKPCCRVCVLLDHSDHEVKKIWEEFRSILQEVQQVSEEYQSRSNHMKRFEKQMKFLKNSEVSSKIDVLIQEIEDHSEICIQQIIKEKEELKEKVRRNYQVVSDVYDWLEKIPALEKLDNAVIKSKALQIEVELHPHDVEKLLAMKRQIVDSGLPEKNSVDKCTESFSRLFRYPFRFVPNRSAPSIGNLVSETPLYPRRNDSIDKCKLVFEKELAVNVEANYIPCVANLGNDFYAIAHPTVPGTPSKAIDIYKLPGELQRTITDHVNPVYDIAATPDGQLAVLSDGQTQDSCSVRLFDPATGEMKSTRDIPVRGPISFDVNLCHECAVLSRTEDGLKKVTIVDEVGSVVFTKVIGRSIISDISRIACCGGVTILMGPTCMYDAKDCKAIHFDSYRSRSYYTRKDDGRFKDVSVTWFGEVTVCYEIDGNQEFLRSSIYHGYSVMEDFWNYQKYTTGRGEKAESRLSVRGGYIVSSQGHTIRVFNEAE